MAIIEFERPFIVGDLLQLCGLSIGTKKAENTIISSSTIDEIYENYGYVNLKQTLSLIKNTWGGDKDSFHHNIMKAVSTLLTAHAYLNEVIFIKEVGKVSVNNLIRLGKEKRAGFWELRKQLWNFIIAVMFCPRMKKSIKIVSILQDVMTLPEPPSIRFGVIQHTMKR